MVISLFSLIMIIAIDNPTVLKHRFNLKNYKLDQLRNIQVQERDSDRIRMLLLERVRIRKGLTKDDFEYLSADELYDIIEDDMLTDFILDVDAKYSRMDLEEILLRIRSWEE